MAFIPSSSVWICKVPWDSTYKNQVYFKSIEEQNQYFARGTGIIMNVVKHVLSDYLVVRKVLPNGRLQSSIKVGLNIDDLYGCNYLRYQNANHGDKWFYAFITNLIYVNVNNTEIVFETDVWQTWCFDIEILPSYVAREHSETDEIGDNCVPEKFTAQDYDYVAINTDCDKLEKWGYLIGASESVDEDAARGTTHSGIYQGMYFYYIGWTQDDQGMDFAPSPNIVNEVLDKIEEAGNDCVQFVALIPDFNMQGIDVDSGTHQVKQSGDPNQRTFLVDVSTVSEFGGYQPKNKKLYTSPFFNLVVTNHNGEEGVYNLEQFGNAGSWGKVQFRMYGDVSPSPSVTLIPLEYKGAEENYDFGISIGAFPQCSFNTDSYKLWLAKNQFTQVSNVIADGAKIIGGMAVGASVGAIAGGYLIKEGVEGILSTIQQDQVMRHEPNKVNAGNARTNLLTAINQNRFDFFCRSIRRDYAQTIDDFFTMYGYQTNRVKTPNLSSRPYYNYVETVGANIVGGKLTENSSGIKTFTNYGIPNDDMTAIKQMFNSGVTFWKPTAILGDYSVDNSPQ